MKALTYCVLRDNLGSRDSALVPMLYGKPSRKPAILDVYAG
jgi:hypothetical protein